jgi:hypothetical protein
VSEEVKVVVRQESEGTALKDAGRDAEAAQVKIKALRAEAEKLRASADSYSNKHGFEDSRAKSARADASALEREAGRLERPFLDAEKHEQKAARDEKAKHLREQRAEDRAAAADERTVKREMHQEETHRQRFGRAGMRLGMEVAQGGSLTGGLSSLARSNFSGLAGGAAVGAVAMIGLVEELTKDYMERQGIALRDQAARKMNERQLGIMAGVRGTSGQAQSEQYAIEQRMAEREANRPDLEQEGKRAWFNPLRLFGSQTWEGQRNLDENDKKQKADADQLEKVAALKREKFENEEGGLQLDALRNRSKRTLTGQRAAFMDEYLEKGLGMKRHMAAEGATPEQQNEAARLEMTNSLRDRQQAAGAGLVTARSGAADIARSAAWGQQVNPNESALIQRFDKMAAVWDAHRQDQKLKDQSIPPPAHTR